MYRAVFEVPATVRIEVMVNEAKDQTDALAQAYDQVMASGPESATVLEVHTQAASNVLLERVSNAGAQVPTPQSVQATQRDGYLLHLYRGDLPELGSDPDSVDTVAELALAKTKLTERVGEDGREFASGRVLNKVTGSVMATLRNKRGGWEVEAISDSGAAVHAETWLTKETAMSTAKLLAVRAGISEVRVMDFTDRQAGPKLHRRLA